MPVDGVPPIDRFSSTEYEDYEWSFSDLESATLYKNGNAEPIATDDPRLIQLLNFIMFSHNNGGDVYLFGYVKEAESNEIFQSGEPLLEVCFSSSSDVIHSELAETRKIWIYNDYYLIFIDRDRPGYYWATENLADKKWPYRSLLNDLRWEGLVTDEQLEGVVWLDLLTYAGFC